MQDLSLLSVIAIRRAAETEMRSALPHAPVITEPARRAGRPRTYRSRAAIATRLDRIADAIAPSGWAPAQRTVSSR
jgi:hypothetical protein